MILRDGVGKIGDADGVKRKLSEPFSFRITGLLCSTCLPGGSMLAAPFDGMLP
jgi:hypothetical protein